MFKHSQNVTQNIQQDSIISYFYVNNTNITNITNITQTLQIFTVKITQAVQEKYIHCIENSSRFT